MAEDRLETAPYGSWRSPISAELVAAGGVVLEEARAGDDAVYWLEGRPSEGGRGVVCRWAPGEGITELTPPGFDARTTVHEYGGGAFLADGQVVFFSNLRDQRLWRQDGGGEPGVLASGRDFYAAPRPSPDGRQLAWLEWDHPRMPCCARWPSTTCSPPG